MLYHCLNKWSMKPLLLYVQPNCRARARPTSFMSSHSPSKGRPPCSAASCCCHQRLPCGLVKSG